MRELIRSRLHSRYTLGTDKKSGRGLSLLTCDVSLERPSSDEFTQLELHTQTFLTTIKSGTRMKIFN